MNPVKTLDPFLGCVFVRMCVCVCVYARARAHAHEHA